MNKFWMVWGIGTVGPSTTYATFREASTEAQRLALLHPETHFVVLESQCDYVMCTIIKTEHK
jgi:hypothetical protein